MNMAEEVPEYEKIDQEVICGQIMNSLEDVDQFLKQISAALALADLGKKEINKCQRA